MKNFDSRYLWWLLLILVLAGILRFYGLGRADVITDEALIAFRSIGYIDFFVSPYQTTPYEWFSDIPTWARLSFHDHPPLVFLLQHLFFNLFGQSVFVLRLPFVLAGIISVFLVYSIGRKLFSQQIGLISSLFLAVSSYPVWISRIGLQESLVILFSLLTFYLFLCALDSGAHWQWGIALGLALLTKYTAFILLLIFVVYLLLFKRFIFKDKRFWLALILAILIFSPVIVYNLKLFQATSHFDLQLSYLFKQNVPEWQFLPGRIMAGTFFERLENMIPALYQGMLWPMFILFMLSLWFGAYQIFKALPHLRSGSLDSIEQKNQEIFLLILAIFFYLCLFLLIGPAQRFVATVIPFIILLVSWFIYQQQKLIKYSLVIVLLILEIFFTVNTLLAYYPIGQEGLTYSYLKKESYSWGYNQLNDYLVGLLKDKRPVVTFATRYQFLENIKNQALNKAEEKNKKPEAILLIYDSDMYDLATLWIFHRQIVYWGWPVVTADSYENQGSDFWQDQGIKDFYFFKILDPEILQQPESERTNGAAKLAEKSKEVDLEIIKRPDGRPVFAVYHWQ